jgi:hypothetical protein
MKNLNHLWRLAPMASLFFSNRFVYLERFGESTEMAKSGPLSLAEAYGIHPDAAEHLHYDNQIHDYTRLGEIPEDLPEITEDDIARFNIAAEKVRIATSARSSVFREGPRSYTEEKKQAEADYKQFARSMADRLRSLKEDRGYDLLELAQNPDAPIGFLIDLYHVLIATRGSGVCSNSENMEHDVVIGAIWLHPDMASYADSAASNYIHDLAYPFEGDMIYAAKVTVAHNYELIMAVIQDGGTLADLPGLAKMLKDYAWELQFMLGHQHFSKWMRDQGIEVSRR